MSTRFDRNWRNLLVYRIDIRLDVNFASNRNKFNVIELFLIRFEIKLAEAYSELKKVIFVQLTEIDRWFVCG